MKITKKSHSTLRAKRATFTKKKIKNAKNGQFWRVFENLKFAVKQLLPDRSVLIGQKLVENAKIEKLKCNILSDFQTMWLCSKEKKNRNSSLKGW